MKIYNVYTCVCACFVLNHYSLVAWQAYQYLSRPIKIQSPSSLHKEVVDDEYSKYNSLQVAYIPCG